MFHVELHGPPALSFVDSLCLSCIPVCSPICLCLLYFTHFLSFVDSVCLSSPLYICLLPYLSLSPLSYSLPIFCSISVCLSVCPSICHLSVHLPVCLSAFLFVYMCMSVCACMSAHLCLSVCSPLFHSVFRFLLFHSFFSFTHAKSVFCFLFLSLNSH